jgi:ribosomal protein L11 methyltransferase
MKHYIRLSVECANEEMADIVMAFLADYPFESFDARGCDEGVELHAFILEECWTECREEALAAVAKYASSISESIVEDENWNQRWEQESFEVVDIDSKILIRAPYHEPPTDAEVMDIVVTPRMSFGSGHHHTTRMMCRLIHASKPSGRALDVGCGTGVLSFVALKCGAQFVEAIDIDPWSTESAARAAELNGVAERIHIITGTVEAIEGETYDTIYANINRNIILGDIARYTAALNAGGSLYVSGFLSEDVEHITSAAAAHGLNLTTQLEEEGWVAIAFHKAQ